MKLKVSRFFVAVCCMVLVIGCLPEASRKGTEIKSAADVKITAGSGKVVEAPAESAPAASTSAASSPAPAATTAPAPMAATSSAPAAAATPAAPQTSPAPAPAATAVATKASADGQAKFAGRVVIKGAIPSLPVKLAKGASTKDAICAENDIPDPRLVSGADGGVGDVIIYMAKAPASGVPAPSGDAPVIDQKGCVFIPHITICRIGQPVKLLNSDPVAHNVNFTGLSDQFNQILGQAQETSYEFKKAARQPIPVKCDIHGWMSAHVLPLDHPWAAVTDASGNFEISSLPPGEHTFVVWHEAIGYIERAVKVSAVAGQVTEQVFTVDISKFKFE